MSFKKLIRTLQVFFPQGSRVKGYVQRSIRRIFRVPSESTYFFFEKFPFQNDGVFIDIGANRGQTIASFRLYHPKVPIVSFEPNPILAQNLETLYGSDPHLKIQKYGLGESDCDLNLYVPSYHGFVFDGLASFDRVEAVSLLNSDWIYWFKPKWLVLDQTICRVRTLDSFGIVPALIKIDVQGFEVPVLKGAGETIARYRPVLIIENDEIMAHENYLTGLGYVKVAYEPNKFVIGESGYRNSIFIPEEKISDFSQIYSSR